MMAYGPDGLIVGKEAIEEFNRKYEEKKLKFENEISKLLEISLISSRTTNNDGQCLGGYAPVVYRIKIDNKSNIAIHGISGFHISYRGPFRKRGFSIGSTFFGKILPKSSVEWDDTRCSSETELLLKPEEYRYMVNSILFEDGVLFSESGKKLLSNVIAEEKNREKPLSIEEVSITKSNGACNILMKSSSECIITSQIKIKNIGLKNIEAIDSWVKLKGAFGTEFISQPFEQELSIPVRKIHLVNIKFRTDYPEPVIYALNKNMLRFVIKPKAIFYKDGTQQQFSN